MKHFREYLHSFKFNRAALVESGKLSLALVGAGTILGNLAVMLWWQLAFGLCLCAAVWFGLYTQMEGVQ